MAEKKKVKNNLAEMPDDLITQSEAAEISNRSIAAINELVRRGRLRSFERYGRTLVSRAEVEVFEPSKGGRPLKSSAGTKKRATASPKRGNRVSSKKSGQK